MAVTQHDRVGAPRVRPAGAILLSGLIASLVWRIVLAPTLLGDFDPRDMPPHQRAQLALGLLTSALIAVTGLAVLARALRGTDVGRIIAGASLAAFVGAAILAAAIGLLFAGSEFLWLFTAYAVLTFGAWIVTSAALVRSGVLKWSAIATTLLSALAMASLVVGAAIIFISFVAILPLASGLLLRQSRAQ